MTRRWAEQVMDGLSAPPDSRYYWQDLDEANVGDLIACTHGGELIAIVDEVDGGIIGYAIGPTHANKIVKALEIFDGR